MKFKKINIEGFRGIKKTEIDDLSLVNIFLGQNNCGKTSLLEAIFLLSSYDSADAVLKIDLSRDLLHNEENDFSFIFYNLNYFSNLKLAAEMHDRDLITLEIIPKDTTGQSKIFSPNDSISSNFDEDIKNSLTNENSKSLVNQIEFKGSIKGFQKSRVEYRSSIIGAKIGGEFQLTTKPDAKKVMPKFHAILQTSSLRHSKDLPRRLQKIIIEKKKEELVKNLKQIDNSITDITAFNDNMIYVDIGAKSLIPSNLMGDGFLKYLNTITNLNLIRGGVMLIDELDNGLHFKALKILWRILIKTAKAFKTQLFITTHSKEALIYLKEVLEEDDYINFQNDVKCFTISKLNDSTLKAYKYDFEAFEYAIENDIEIRGEI